jgi:hypothetical protein
MNAPTLTLFRSWFVKARRHIARRLDPHSQCGQQAMIAAARDALACFELMHGSH